MRYWPPKPTAIPTTPAPAINGPIFTPLSDKTIRKAKIQITTFKVPFIILIDLISGLFIILENQYRVGDVAEIGGKIGLVEDISLRVTILRDLDGIVYHVPHGEITTVSNYSKGISKVNLNVGISYSADIDKVEEIINIVGEDLSQDEKFSSMIIESPKFLRVDKLGDSSVEVKIVGVTKPAKQWEVMGELRRRIKKAFDENGIEIPFPQIVIHKA